ncbi:MAG: nucleotidyl transferase AbiEii/AbiGii toxin family protein [Patescibacteria group bacterium]|nr:nucleotidyl transferase AbiEii/AbiGii toxin family protein [Patescibacteria group bacterium]
MITEEQIYILAKKHKINESVILREYLQLFFLNELYSEKNSEKIFFKGGTALRLIYNSPRFSEDLDFTVEIKEKDFDKFISILFKKIEKKESVTFKPKKTLAGKSFLLKNNSPLFSNKILVCLDFSFREKIMDPQKSIINTDYPVLFTSYIYNLSKKEILAEKIRALLTRKKTKGRDFYDIWYLLNQNVELDKGLINKKLKYYNLELNKDDVLKKIKNFSKKDFILDIRPFVPVNERSGLGKLFDYLKRYLEQKLNL